MSCERHRSTWSPFKACTASPTFRPLNATCNFSRLLLRSWWLRLRVRYRRNQLLDDLAARLVANVVDFFNLDICVLLRIVLGLLIA